MNNKKIICTPVRYYIIAFIFMLCALITWIIFILITNEDDYSIAVDLAKNSFFAIMGSLLVSFLIDLGNTSRDNKVKNAAFNQLKAVLKSIYMGIESVSFILSNAFIINDAGDIKLEYYYNQEFCYKNKNVVSYKTIKDISSFKNGVNNSIDRIINSTLYLNLDDGLRNIIEQLYIDSFPCISYLTNEFIESGIRMSSLKGEIKKLAEITVFLSNFLGCNSEISFLSEEEANSYHTSRIEYLKRMKTGIQ